MVSSSSSSSSIAASPQGCRLSLSAVCAAATALIRENLSLPLTYSLIYTYRGGSFTRRDAAGDNKVRESKIWHYFFKCREGERM